MRGQGRSRPHFLRFFAESVHPPPQRVALESRGRRGAPTLAALFVTLAASSCMDLDVTNINEPDYERALATAGDVEALIKASYNSWFSAVYGGESSSYVTPGFFLSQQAFQNALPWTNFGTDEFANIPRVAYPTVVT
ncbi:hypothetical protein ACFL3S_10005, partial [Gemmatimonadota bacterium]